VREKTKGEQFLAALQELLKQHRARFRSHQAVVTDNSKAYDIDAIRDEVPAGRENRFHHEIGE
jgi:hypothetical protein